MKYLFVIVSILGCCLYGQSVHSEERGFHKVFDGKTLDGWKPTAGAENAWRVEDGILIGTGDKGRGYLTYTGNLDIADLEMKFSYRFPDKGNSGVSIRAVKDETGTRDFKSYHADLGHKGIGKNVMGAWDFHTPGRREHRCFRGDSLIINKDDSPSITEIENSLTNADIKANQWNEVHIIARNNHFQLIINGKLSSEFKEFLPKTSRLDSGMIQLQLHDPGMIVEFKEILLKIIR
ncbi:MAG: hypothetical protein CMJ76_10775 [Planctomycetaceae bacterium]|nr:hypothetical protein [Planctomycetaceae bacterium]